MKNQGDFLNDCDISFSRLVSLMQFNLFDYVTDETRTNICRA